MKNTVLDVLKPEFDNLLGKFEFHELDYTSDYWLIKDIEINSPGCYIIYFKKKVLKIGRHFINSKKRAFDHFIDNTGDINSYDKNEIKIILINTKERKDDFWIASLEIYLEKELNPKIKSKRIG